jgi:integrase
LCRNAVSGWSDDRVMTEQESGNRHARLTKRAVNALTPASDRYTVWDVELRGFGLRVEPSGAMSYLVRYRPRGSARQRQITLGRHGVLTADEAREAARKALGAVAHGGDPMEERSASRDGLTLQELADRFLREHTEKKLKASTADYYRWTLERYALPSLGKRKALEIAEGDVSRLHSNLSATPFQANRVLAVLASLFSWGRRRKLLPENFNPTQHVDKYPERSRERYLTREELERLGASLRVGETVGFPRKTRSDKRAPKEGICDIVSPYAAAAIRLLLFTGARLGEILSLRWEYVDMERQALFLPDSKTGSKVVMLNAPAMAVIAGLERMPDNPFVICGIKEGEPLADLKRPWRNVLGHAGLEGVRLHDLRHTFASYGAAASMGLPVIGKLLGHTQAATTARYAHLADDPLRRASASIADSISAAMGEKVQARSADIVSLPTARRAHSKKQE